MFYFRFFLIPLFVTVVIEEIAALIWGIRSRKDLLALLWINAVTNLAVSAIRYMSNQLVRDAPVRVLILIAAEVLVVISEWQLFKRFIKGGHHYLIMSVVFNAASYGAGLLIPVVMPLLINAGG